MECSRILIYMLHSGLTHGVHTRQYVSVDALRLPKAIASEGTARFSFFASARCSQRVDFRSSIELDALVTVWRRRLAKCYTCKVVIVRMYVYMNVHVCNCMLGVCMWLLPHKAVRVACA